MKLFSEQLKSKRMLLIIGGFLLCVLTAFAVRTYHYNTAVHTLGGMTGNVVEDPGFFRKFTPYYHSNFSPFTIESAMMFSYAQDIAGGKGVPASDKRLLGQEDLPPYAQMNMALEWFLGWGYRIKNAVFPDPPPTPEELRFQDNPHMAQWMSMQLRLWVSLISGLIFLWLIILKCPLRLALFGGMLHAFSLAAVARATGQDIVRGEFCIPLIVGAFVLAYSLYRNPARWKYLLLFLVTFVAFAAWDLCQMLFSCWALFEIFRVLLGGRVKPSRIRVWMMILCAVALNALFVPFNKTYGLLMSPLLCIILPTLFALYFFGNGVKAWKRFVLLLCTFGILYGIWSVLINNPLYVSHYSHFSEAMKAKIEFNNVKPADPSLLSYDARILWTPSMHSATWQIAKTFFPSFLLGGRLNFKPLNFLLCEMPLTLAFFYALLLLASLFALPRNAIRRGLPRSLLPILFTVGFTVGFIYIVRYHEFLIIFLALALPLLVQDYLHALRYRPECKDAPEAYLRLCARRRLMKTLRWMVIAVCGLCMIVEVDASLFKIQRKYTGDIQFQETVKLIEWFRRYPETRGKGVIANFTTGPMLKAYCGSAIALNPQFGLERIRRPTELFINAIYDGTEKQLAEFCNGLNADFLLYNKGFAGPMHIYSTRYIADAKEIRGDSPVNLMYFHSNRLKWFYRIDPPQDLSTLTRVYSVFRVIRPQDKINSLKLLAVGEQILEEGGREQAARFIVNAVLLDPTNENARNAFTHIFGRPPVITLGGIR